MSSEHRGLSKTWSWRGWLRPSREHMQPCLDLVLSEKGNYMDDSPRTLFPLELENLLLEPFKVSLGHLKVPLTLIWVTPKQFCISAEHFQAFRIWVCPALLVSLQMLRHVGMTPCCLLPHTVASEVPTAGVTETSDSSHKSWANPMLTLLIRCWGQSNEIIGHCRTQ